MTPEILEQIKEVATNPVAAEKLCGKSNVEFHPLACDLVEAATDPNAKCRHVPAAIRAQRESAYAKLVAKRVAAE